MTNDYGLEPLRCNSCGTAVVWEKPEHVEDGGTMVCSCNSVDWSPGKGMMPWEKGYGDSRVLVSTPNVSGLSHTGVDRG